MQKALYFFLLIFLFPNLSLSAQSLIPVAFDLASPIDVNVDTEDQAWVTLSGTGFDDGQVVRLLSEGTKEVIIEGLPSLLATKAPRHRDS